MCFYPSMEFGGICFVQEQVYKLLCKMSQVSFLCKNQCTGCYHRYRSTAVSSTMELAKVKNQQKCDGPK